ncbi:HD domain-containing phosphohydrolase [Caldimonas sp.]|uniref:response regulator n=1 Tax=Caldimonas sp. TaxID=2838790 RepID=UPI00307EBD6F
MKDDTALQAVWTPWTALQERPRLLLVDDEPANLQLLKRVLEPLYTLSFARHGMQALEMAKRLQPALIVLDVMMPGMTGHEVIVQLKADAATASIPVLFCTALGDEEDEARGLDLGAVDYVTKPISPAVLKARIRTHLALVQRQELERTRQAVIWRLGRAAEFKDNETGRHVIRMSKFSRLIAQALGAPPVFCDLIEAAAPMHDIGKIGIPDRILLKPGKLDEDEWAVMRTHPLIGAQILGDDDSPLLQMASRIAAQHHEKWDGSGYPQGLAGEAIAVEARIVAVADVFDALTSVRPYKPAWPIEQALAWIDGQSGQHFWPPAVQALHACLEEIVQVRQQWRDIEPMPAQAA